MEPDEETKLRFDEFDKERGFYEPDLLYENGWKFRWNVCKKHRGHQDFIPRQDFCVQHLPVHVQQPEFVEFFKCVADLTCRLVMSYISFSRPDRFPFSAFKGKNISMVGTGIVRPTSGVILHTDSLCPCKQCKGSAHPHRVWAEVSVHTAAHNVCDLHEAESTKVELFYDTEEDRRAGRVRTLDVVGVESCHVERDVSILKCATHDSDLYDMIEDAVERLANLRVKTERIYRKMVAFGDWPDGNVCVIPSHPHGSYKHLTIGHVLVSQSYDKVFWKKIDSLVYRTPTCPGSSGAPVACLGETDRVLMTSPDDVPSTDGPVKLNSSRLFVSFYPPHSGATRTPGVNMSGRGFW